MESLLILLHISILGRNRNKRNRQNYRNQGGRREDRHAVKRFLRKSSDDKGLSSIYFERCGGSGCRDPSEGRGTRFPCDGVGDPSRTQPHVVNVSFPGVDSEALMLALREDLAISNGAACTSASYAPSHVLKAMGLGEDIIASAVRISWGPGVTVVPAESIVAVVTMCRPLLPWQPSAER
jgi:hypothetical protein